MCESLYLTLQDIFYERWEFLNLYHDSIDSRLSMHDYWLLYTTLNHLISWEHLLLARINVSMLCLLQDLQRCEA